MSELNTRKRRPRKIKKNKDQKRNPSKSAPRRADGPIIARLKVRKNATPSEIYAAYREQFTAADLQRYTEVEPMIPADQLLAELAAIHRDETRKRKKKR